MDCFKRLFQKSVVQPKEITNVVAIKSPAKPSGERTRGVDVSHHNDSVNFDQLKAGGWHFAFMKATEGTMNVDPRFQTRWAHAKAAGLVRGAYHFFRPLQDAKVQADHFLKTVGILSPGDMIVFDFEVWDGVPPREQIHAALIWLDHVESVTGKKPLVYASPSFITELGSPEALGAYKLWIANYKVAKPRVPAPWKEWTFWQDSESGVAPGIAGHCDTDFFNGSLEELIAFSKS